MKLRLLSIATAALFAGQAHALDIATTTASGTLKVYAAGASAIRNIVGQIFLQNCASNLDIYYSTPAAAPDGSASAFASDAATGDSHRVYSCTLKAEANLEGDLKGKGLGGKNIAFFKRDAGGSGQGVFPVAIPSNTANLLISTASCATTNATAGFDPVTGVTTASFICSKSENVRAPELGFSDVEPSLFKGMNTPAGFSTSGLTSAQLSGLQIVPTFQTVMAVAVSNSLYTALQAAQGTSGVPSIPRTIFGSLLRGELADPQGGLGWQALNVANPTQQVNVCRRTAGSGSQAAANILSSNFPCAGTANVAPAVNGSSDPVQTNSLTPASWTTGNLYVYEGGSTGNVGSCLSNANDAGGYAIGHISRDNAEPANGKWKFIALDGVVPHRDTLKTGSYDYAVESTAQYRKALITTLNAGTADDKAKAGFITGFALAVGRPVNMDKLSTATKAGLAALPTAGIYADPDNAINATFVSRVSRNSGNNCTPWGVVQ